MRKFNTDYRGKLYLDFIPNENIVVEFIINSQRVIDLCVEFQCHWIVKQILKDWPTAFRTDEDYERGIEVLRNYVVFSEGGM